MTVGRSSRPLTVVAVPESAGSLLPPDLLDDLRERLRDALSGAGPVLQPRPTGRPGDDVTLDGPRLDGTRLDDARLDDDPHDPIALALATSGTTTPASAARERVALLPASSLLASAAATHERLGGPGRWLLALPLTHVAGWQVLVRSLVAGTRPATPAGGDDPTASLVAAVGGMRGVRRYTALVPTQLMRVLDAGPAATGALADLDAVLVGGAPCPSAVAARARRAGVRLVETYGATETCGGCVYDGVPLAGVRVSLDPHPGSPEGEGRVVVRGPVLARGYLHDDASTAAAFRTGPDGHREFLTGDLGRLGDAGSPQRLAVLRRLDDVILTGGVNVSAGAVEAVLAGLPGVAEAVVVGIPDVERGLCVAAAVVPAGDAAREALAPDRLRGIVRAALGSAAAPRHVAVLDALPRGGAGKPDRRRIARMFDDAAARPSVPSALSPPD